MYQSACGFLSLANTAVFRSVSCSSYKCDSYLCERDLDQHRLSLKHSIPLFEPRSKDFVTSMKSTFMICPGGHVVHDFLSCDADSHCGVAQSPELCAVKHADPVGEGDGGGHVAAPRTAVSVEMFQCQQYGGAVPYTLLCDFRHDCADSSDEKHCKHHDSASGFRCSNKQTVPRSKLCDFISDCLDGSDETACDNYHQDRVWLLRRLSPAVIHVDWRSGITQTAMTTDQPCPETHFRCPHPVYCMPAFLRCNGVNDCPYGEDEVSCEAVTCPGHYRCRASSVCLNPSHVCDGWPQCPQRDDELLCNATCPSACQCQGLAFVCDQPFPAREYPDLRYLDGTGSGITPLDVSDIFYLVSLKLASCKIGSWPHLHLVNLQRLDLSYNRITTLDLHNYTFLQKLRFLCLKGNPLHINAHTTPSENQVSLLVVDLSYTHLYQFNSTLFQHFLAIETLNISFSKLKAITVFDHLPKLKQLDLSGCDIRHFPTEMFATLTELQFIKGESFKLCCEAILPETFNINLCHAPHDALSSCQDMLRSTLHRVCFSILGVLSLLGNAGCCLFRLSQHHHAEPSHAHSVFITNLELSDFLTGVYVASIAVVDEIYRGVYLWHDTAWKESVLCKAAGFLSFLSNEVSAFMICLITLDRFIVLHFPFSTVRFNTRSALVTSALAWLCGLVLAAVPLLPALSHWRFYGHTGICIPLPVTRNTFTGQTYSFGVMTAFNFVLFVLIAVSQAFIYRTVKAESTKAILYSKAPRDVTVARRLITVVVSDFLCWFPIGVLGMMAFNGTPVPSEVNVVMAIFVLPLNSALNPFLYTVNVLMGRRRQAREARLLKLLQARVKARQFSATAPKPKVDRRRIQ